MQNYDVSIQNKIKPNLKNQWPKMPECEKYMHKSLKLLNSMS